MIAYIKNLFYSSRLIFLGFLIFSFYFWSRFLRHRNSKYLPLDLSVLKFFILLYTCLIFLYIVLSLLFLRKGNAIIEKIIDWGFIPLNEFDKFLKNIPIIKRFYKKILFSSIPKLEYLIIETDLFFIILWIFPRLILLAALYIDVFLFHQLHYKYYVVLVGLLLFFNRYFKYSLKFTKLQLITYYTNYIHCIITEYCPGVHPSELAPDYDPNDPDEDEYIEYMSLPLDIFIEHQTKSIVYKKITRKMQFICPTPKLTDKLWIKYVGHKDPLIRLNQKLPESYTNKFGNNSSDCYQKACDLIFKKHYKFKHKVIEKIMKISLLIEFYNKTSNQDETIKKIKILIYTLYFICWLYVLIISMETLDINKLFETINETWEGIVEPFSITKVK